MNNQLEYLDIISILSFFISLINLSLNQEQNDKLDKHLQNQDSEVYKKLEKLMKQNEEIIKLIKEDYYHA